MSLNSKAKGKVGERDAAKCLSKALGCKARRGQQYAGNKDTPDICHDIDGVHIEVKRREGLSLYPAMDQAIADAEDNVPIVLHRRNNKPWLVILQLDDLLEFVDRLNRYKRRRK